MWGGATVVEVLVQCSSDLNNPQSVYVRTVDVDIRC